MKVHEVMRRNVIRVKRSTPLRVLLDMFKAFQTLPTIPVVDDEEHLIGVVYPENLLDILRPPHSRLLRSVPFVEVDKDVFDLDPAPSMGDLIIVDDIMEKGVISIQEGHELLDVYRLMKLHKKERFPVVDSHKKLLGIVGMFDIIRRMFQEKGIV